MKRPLIDYWMRLASKGNARKEKILQDKIEYHRVMREADREIEKLIMPIVKWLDKIIRKVGC